MNSYFDKTHISINFLKILFSKDLPFIGVAAIT